MLRAAALSLLMLFSVVTMLPLTNSSAHNNGASAASSHKKRFRRHSRAWWRRYRARQRRKRAELARQKSLEALRAQDPNAASLNEGAALTQGGTYNHPRGLWSVTMPEGWSSRPANEGEEMKFRIYADGKASGQATLSVVAMANGQDNAYSKRKQSQSLSGVPVTALRRTVIDRMIKEGGWVVNDYQKEINGRRVFVVQAQTPSVDGRTLPQAQTYYFTEVDGRIYSLATTAPVDSSERVAAGSEKVMASFRSGNSSTQAAAAPLQR